MVVKKDNSVVASPSPNNSFAQYRSSFSSQPGKVKAPIRLRRNAPTRSGSLRSARTARSARTEERVDVEAYDPFKDEREEVEAEDSRSLFSEENSRDLWPPMPLDTAPQDDDDFMTEETGPTGTPKRKRTGSTPFKPPKPSEGDDDGFTDGFRVSYSSSTPQRTSKSSDSSNVTNNNQISQPYDEFRASSAATTPTRASMPSVLNKYKPSGGETNDGFRASYSSPTNNRRLSQSSVSSSKNGNNEAETSTGFRSSFSSAFTPQRGARLSIGSTNTTQTANDNGSVTSASQRSKSGVSSKYAANLSQASEKSNNQKLVATPLRSKKSSVSNRYLSAVTSKGQDNSNTTVPEASTKDNVSAKVDMQSKVVEPEKAGGRRRSSSFASAQKMWLPNEQPKMEEPKKVEMPTKTEPEKATAPRRSSSFSSAQKMWSPNEKPKNEEPEKVEIPAKTEPVKATPPRRSFSSAQKMWSPNEKPKMEEPEKVEIPAKTEPVKATVPRRSFSSAQKMWVPQEQPKKTFAPYTKKSTTKKADDEVEKIVESKMAEEMSKMKIQFDEEVQRIEERLEQKYMERIAALEEKTDKLKKILGKMISKRKSMDTLDMDRVEV